MSTNYHELEEMCRKIRLDIIEMLHHAQSGHPGGSLSCVEILVDLYFEHMHVRPDQPDWPDRDRLILSKGHAAPALYSILAEKGFFPKEKLMTLRQPDSILQGHPNALITPGIDATSGPLGLGLSFAVGQTLSAKMKGQDFIDYVLLGDGEIQEGVIWEAAMSASKFHCDHIIAILDWNHVQLDGKTDEIMPLGDIKGKFEAFGWRTIECDGHNLAEISHSIEEAKKFDGRPTIILARTVKGKSVSFMENRSEWHGKPIDDEHYQIAVSEIGGH